MVRVVSQLSGMGSIAVTTTNVNTISMAFHYVDILKRRIENAPNVGNGA